MSIIRVSKNKDYSVISNFAANDVRLSWKAKGILYYLLTKPDGWKINRDQLASVSSDGVTAVRSALSELEAAGYLKRTRGRAEDGSWQWDSVIYESAFPSVENRPVDFTPVENQPIYKDTVLASTEVVNTEVVKENPLTPKRRVDLRSKQEAVNDKLVEEFNAIWERNPRKDAGYTKCLMSACRLSNADWERAKETLPLWNTQWQRMEAEGRGQYIPHLSTFLNQRRFENPPEGFVLGRAAPEAHPGTQNAPTVNSVANRGISESWVNQWRGITFDYAVKNPDGSVVLYSKDRGSAPPIVIPKEDVDEELQCVCKAV